MPNQIDVVLSKKGLNVSPGEAKAKVGELITWRFILEVEFFPARFTIYFPYGTPFPWHISHMAATTPDDLRKGGAIVAPPMSPGKYKYGVKVNRLDTGEGVEDIDPYLYVYE